MTPSRTDRQGMVAYFQGVWEELRKVVWPTRTELARMTGVVVATVILFGLLIGGADYLLSLAVKQVYGNGTTQTTATPAPNVQPTSAPHATPLP
jgi:preprotein translocase subunit SecE